MSWGSFPASKSGVRDLSEANNQDLNTARDVIEAEIRALQGLLSRLGDGFTAAVDLLDGCKGRVVLTGIGKAGIVGQKISATLASTGTPSYSLHPVEALHGDLGRIHADDVVIALSNSGETEVVALLPAVKRIGARIIAVTGDTESTLARHSDVVLCIGDIEEACPLGLAPSASTTAMLAMGDALALTVARRRSFDKEQYALYHPGGQLGRELMKVEEVMRSLDEFPHVIGDTPVKKVLDRGRAGAICVIDEDGMLTGIFTDGDLRRRILEEKPFLDKPIADVMIANPKRITMGSLAHEAAKIAKEFGIDDLPVVDAEGRLTGLIDIQDLLAVRIIAP